MVRMLAATRPSNETVTRSWVEGTCICGRLVELSRGLKQVVLLDVPGSKLLLLPLNQDVCDYMD